MSVKFLAHENNGAFDGVRTHAWQASTAPVVSESHVHILLASIIGHTIFFHQAIRGTNISNRHQLLYNHDIKLDFVFFL